MMILLLATVAAALATQMVHMSPLDQRSFQLLCIDKTCYTISPSRKDYKEANKTCRKLGGRLMSVRNTVEAEAISLLMRAVDKDNPSLWIGLEQPDNGKCTDLSQKLRGYTWTTGDSDTDYSNWLSEEVRCGELCVSVQGSLWRETKCTIKADGFLCELALRDMCAPIMVPEGYNVTYDTIFTLQSAFPPGTSASVTGIETSLVCTQQSHGATGWSSEAGGPWACPIENGGCEYICAGDYRSPVCVCEDGSSLRDDRRSCSPKQGPCDPNPCGQQCTPGPAASDFICMCDEGYILGDDGKSCQDKDDCAMAPQVCEQQCTNTIGSFVCRCHPGYEEVDGRCEDIDECLQTKPPCDQSCANTPGSYVCSCDPGFIADGGKCKQFCNDSSCAAICEDVHANMGCSCPDGYILVEDDTGMNYGSDVPICIDIDECVGESCEYNCTNLFGTYICSCWDGYVLHNDHTCVPEEGSGGTEEPSQMPPSTPSPPYVPILQPAMLLGISVGILSILTILLGIICHMVRKHHTDQAAMDYKCKSLDKNVVLQQVKITPQHKV